MISYARIRNSFTLNCMHSSPLQAEEEIPVSEDGKCRTWDGMCVNKAIISLGILWHENLMQSATLTAWYSRTSAAYTTTPHPTQLAALGNGRPCVFTKHCLLWFPCAPRLHRLSVFIVLTVRKFELTLVGSTATQQKHYLICTKGSEAEHIHKGNAIVFPEHEELLHDGSQKVSLASPKC